MKGAFFSWSWLSQKYCFGNEISLGWFYTMKVPMCVPSTVGQALQRTKLCGCARGLDVLG